MLSLTQHQNNLDTLTRSLFLRTKQRLTDENGNRYKYIGRNVDGQTYYQLEPTDEETYCLLFRADGSLAGAGEHIGDEYLMELQEGRINIV